MLAVLKYRKNQSMNQSTKIFVEIRIENLLT